LSIYNPDAYLPSVGHVPQVHEDVVIRDQDHGAVVVEAQRVHEGQHVLVFDLAHGHQQQHALVPRLLQYTRVEVQWRRTLVYMVVVQVCVVVASNAWIDTGCISQGKCFVG
jgi:hypothetical protein